MLNRLFPYVLLLVCGFPFAHAEEVESAVEPAVEAEPLRVDDAPADAAPGDPAAVDTRVEASLPIQPDESAEFSGPEAEVLPLAEPERVLTEGEETSAQVLEAPPASAAQLPPPHELPTATVDENAGAGDQVAPETTLREPVIVGFPILPEVDTPVEVRNGTSALDWLPSPPEPSLGGAIFFALLALLSRVLTAARQPAAAAPGSAGARRAGRG